MDRRWDAGLQGNRGQTEPLRWLFQATMKSVALLLSSTTLFPLVDNTASRSIYRVQFSDKLVELAVESWRDSIFIAR